MVECTKQARAYVEDDSDNARTRYNLNEHVELVTREVPGSDGTPTFVDAGCGYKFDIDPRQPWDVNVVDGNVVEEHVELSCPKCGSTADHLSRPIQTVPVASYQVAKIDEALAEVFGSAYDPSLPENMKEALYAGAAQLIDGQFFPVVQGAADTGYAHFTEGAVALAAATAKTVIGGKSHANFAMSLTHVSVGFDGVTASAVPVLVELNYITWATNAPGTNSTSTTERQEYGRVLTAGATSGKTWTAEPTVETAMSKEMLLTPNGGLVIFDFPLGKEPDCALGEGFGIRCTAPAIVNVRAAMKWRRC